MNPNLSLLQAYPFERLRQLFADVVPNAGYTPISLGIGEPKHPTPQFIKDAYCGAILNTESIARGGGGGGGAAKVRSCTIAGGGCGILDSMFNKIQSHNHAYLGGRRTAANRLT